MLLTLNTTTQNGIQRPHDHLRFRPTQRSPSPTSNEPPSAVPSRPPDPMDSSRSSLPRHSSLTLPPPDVGFATMPPTTANQQPPPPPSQWQSPDDTAQYWRAKAEEERRKQEVEKTTQETLRLEQRRVEQSMLRDSLTAGIPPHIVPLIFAGIWQNGLPPPVIELAQQYLSQMSGAQASNTQGPPPQAPSHSHSQSHSNPQSRRPSMHARQDSRSGPGPYLPTSAQHVVPPPPPPNILLSQNMAPNASAPSTPQQPGRRSLPAGPDPRAGPAPWISHPGGIPAQPSQVNMGQMQYAPGSSVPAAQPPRRPSSQSRRSPPSLYFHHWVPPAQSQSGAGAGKAHRDSPAPSSASRRSDHASPGRKRKAAGPHQPAPAPSSRRTESLRDFTTSQQESIRGERPLGRPPGHRRQASEASAAHRGHLMEDTSSRTSPSQVPRRQSENKPSPRKTGDLAEDSSPVDGADKNFPQKLQSAYASSVDTGPRDSDIEPSSQQSPKSEAQ